MTPLMLERLSNILISKHIKVAQELTNAMQIGTVERTAALTQTLERFP